MRSQRRKREKSKKHDIIDLTRKDYSFLDKNRGIFIKKIKHSVWIANLTLIHRCIKMSEYRKMFPLVENILYDK